MDTQFDKLVDQFENDLKSGRAPAIEDYLAIWPEESKDRILKELISLEVFYHLKRGDSINASDYARFGQTAAVYAEMALKENSAALDAVGSVTLIPGSEGSSFATIQTGNANEPDKRVGRYKLLNKIGEGGMGTVWLAEQEEPVKRKVALKVIKAALSSKEVVARFEAERQALAMMDHPNIAKVLDAGTAENGSPFIAMELVDGIPITKFCDERRLSVDERLRLILPVCKAVQHAHQKGILHRDLKPSNVLVTTRDDEHVPKVIDFGLAKAVTGGLKLTDKTMQTEFGKVVGTLQYMSPEQAGLDTPDVDTRTDIYSLGVILYELLTGSTPLDKDTLGSNAFLKVLKIIREKDPPRPSNRLNTSTHEAITRVGNQRKISVGKLKQILRGELDWVVMKALEKDRTRRYQTANDFANDIVKYLRGESVEARPISTWYQLQKFASRNRGLVSAILAIGVALLIGIAGTSYGLFRANQKADEAEVNRKLAEEKSKEAEKERRTAKASEQAALKAERIASEESQRAQDAAAAAKFQLANARFEANRASDARDLLHQIPQEYRDNFEWKFCSRHFTGSDITCYGHRSWVYKVAFSPTGKMIASASRDGKIKLWEVESGKEIASLDGHKQQVGSVAFSPDGTRLASASFDSSMKIWDTTTFQEIADLSGHKKLAATVVFSPDGTRLASSSDDKTVKIWDAESFKELMSLSGHQGEVGSVVFSPDGKQLASCSVDNTIKLWNADTGKIERTLTGHLASVISVAYSPDGKLLASASEDIIKLWNPETGEEVTSLVGHSQFVHFVAFSPDGTRLASAGRDRTVKLWDVKTYQQMRTFTGHSGWVNGVAFSPDGSRLASASFDKTVKLWDVRSGQSITSMTGHDREIYGIDISSDGANLISAGRDGLIRFWDLRERKLLSSFRGHRGTISDVAFRPGLSEFASASADGSIKVWNSESTTGMKSLEGHQGRVNAVCYSNDGKLLASASDDRTVRIWNADSAKEITSLVSHQAPVTSVAFFSEGRQLVSGDDDGAIKLWDVESGQVVRTFKPQFSRLSCLAVSPDGKVLVAASNGAIQIWEIESGNGLGTLTGHTEAVTGLTFNSHGTRLASSSYDRSVKLWDVSKKIEITTLDHSDRVFAIKFAPDGFCLVTAGDMGTVKLWEAPSETETLTLKGHSTTVIRAGFSDDGRRVYSQSPTENLVWDVATGHLIEDAVWDPPQNIRDVTGDGLWMVTSESNNVVLVNLGFKDNPVERGFRKAKAKFDAGWHLRQADAAKSSRAWYAAAFHFAWLLQHEPDRAAFHDGLHLAYGKLEEMGEGADRKVDSHLMPLVFNSLKIPRGSLVEESEARSMNGQVWERVKSIASFEAKPLSQPEIDRLRDVVARYPRGIYYNTLATAEYRMGNFSEAIDAALLSVEKTPAENTAADSAYPGDLAILAMSYCELGEWDSATEYLEEMQRLLKLDEYKDDTECIAFKMEVEQLFASKKNLSDNERE